MGIRIVMDSLTERNLAVFAQSGLYFLLTILFTLLCYLVYQLQQTEEKVRQLATGRNNHRSRQPTITADEKRKFVEEIAALQSDTKNVYNICERLNENILEILATNSSLKQKLQVCADRLDATTTTQQLEIDDLRNQLESNLSAQLAKLERLIDQRLEANKIQNTSDVVSSVQHEFARDLAETKQSLKESISQFTNNLTKRQQIDNAKTTTDIIKTVKADISRELVQISKQVTTSERDVGHLKSSICQAHESLKRNIDSLESAQEIIKSDLNVLNRKAQTTDSNVIRLTDQATKQYDDRPGIESGDSQNRRLLSRRSTIRTRIPQLPIAPPAYDSIRK